MKLLSILALLLAVSCSSKTTTCKADTDCGNSQVCNATTGACIAQTTAHCKSSDICSTGYTCSTSSKQCSCGTTDHCQSGYQCSSGSCIQSCTGTGSSTCTQATQTCQSGTCQSSMGLACTSNAGCGTTLGCIANKCAHRRVFVTSQMFSPGTAYSSSNCFPASGTKTCTFNSAANADAACQDFADQQKLGGKWAAWIATSTQPAIERIIPSRIVDGDTADVYLIDNTKISGPVTMTKAKGNFASSCTGSTEADCPDTHSNPINRTEANSVLSQGGDFTVYTGIDKSDFDKSGSLDATCSDWTSNNTSNNFYYGDSNSNSKSWHSSTLTASCSSQQHLYCLEVNQ